MPKRVKSKAAPPQNCPYSTPASEPTEPTRGVDPAAPKEPAALTEPTATEALAAPAESAAPEEPAAPAAPAAPEEPEALPAPTAPTAPTAPMAPMAPASIDVVEAPAPSTLSKTTNPRTPKRRARGADVDKKEPKVAKRTQNAYMFFYKQESQNADLYNGLTLPERAKKIGALWREMDASARMPYTEQAIAAKAKVIDAKDDATDVSIDADAIRPDSVASFAVQTGAPLVEVA